ncbi:MAG: prolipoprotein diacylglyceryl transferase [Nitrospinae bacterium]|nr:prolipoprotein diacylglyceryl transferase [Nitrospinota bacterium]
MFPVILQIGPLKLFTYGLMAAIGLLVGVTLAARRAEKE